MLSSSVIEKLKKIVGKQNVLSSQEDRIVYSYDATPILSSLPAAAIIPNSVEEISEIVQMANKEKFVIVPRGSGTGLSGGTIAGDISVVLLMNKWDKILEIDQENLTALVEPGVITAKLHQEVEKIGLFYPPDPGSMNICTIGGNVAENAGGLRGFKYGVTKDYVMGLEIVLATGEIVNLGGKNVKDVSGYNLKDFLVGSEGTIAIFTKILLKLTPKPQTFKTMLAYFDSMNNAAQTVSDIIAVLYGNVIKLDSNNPLDENRDRLILSKGHACLALYSALVEKNFFPRSELESFEKSGSFLLGHPVMNKEKWNSLPKDIQAIMDEEFGPNHTARTLKMLETEEASWVPRAKKDGYTILDFSKEEQKKWAKLMEPLVQKYAADIDKTHKTKGLGVKFIKFIQEKSAELGHPPVYKFSF